VIEIHISLAFYMSVGSHDAYRQRLIIPRATGLNYPYEDTVVYIEVIAVVREDNM
jgi:hypothetical protein